MPCSLVYDPVRGAPTPRAFFQELPVYLAKHPQFTQNLGLYVRSLFSPYFSLQYNSAVEKYAEKWERFQSTYNDMPKARELTGKQETLKEIKGKGTKLYVMWPYSMTCTQSVCLCVMVYITICGCPYRGGTGCQDS